MRSVRKKKKNNGALLIVLLVAAIALLAVGIIKWTDKAKKEAEDVNIYVISTVMAEGSQRSEDAIADFMEQIRGGNLADNRKKQYKILFRDCVVMGDSIASGLSGYGYLGEDKVFCAIGGSVMNSDEKVSAAAAAKPKKAFFSYGMNDLGMYSGNTSMFIDKYTSLIQSFMDASPDTQIYVNSISKPSDDKISAGGHFYKWEEYNRAIKKMCDSLGATYIDNTSILTEQPGLYAGDGVHVVSSYYPIWIEKMIKAADL